MKELIKLFEELMDKYGADWEIELSSEGCIEIEPKEDDSKEIIFKQ